MKIFTYSTLIAAVSIILCAAVFPGDIRDASGNTYQTIKIADQTWMASDLKTNKFRNGDGIPYARSFDAWEKAVREKTPAYCCSKRDIYGNCSKYLYNWYAVTDPRGIAPEGWHVPSLEEWNELVNHLGGKMKAGNKLKSKSGWVRNGDNESGFNAKPTGIRKGFDPYKIEDVNSNLEYWTTTEVNSKNAYHIGMNYKDRVFIYREYKTSGIAVRCIKDNE